MNIMSGSNKKKNLVKVDGKVFAKTLRFGNQKSKTVHKNKKTYDRKKQWDRE
jgi:hypothetical protein